MQKNAVLRVIAVVFVIALSVGILVAKPINRGLDLQGGIQLTLQPKKMENLSGDQIDSLMEQTLEVFRNRIDEIDVFGTTIQRHGETQILVQIPGVGTEHSDRVKEILLRQARLEFRLVEDNPDDSV